MRFFIAIFLLFSFIDARVHTVAQVKKEYYKLQKMMKNGILNVEKSSKDYQGIGGSAEIYIDPTTGIVRALILDGGTGDSFHRVEYSYDESGELFFSYNRDANVGGCESEFRSYYSGKKLLKRLKKLNKCEPYRAFPFREDNPKKAFEEYQPG